MKRKIGSPAIVCVLVFGSFFLVTSLTSENVEAASTWSIETVDPSAGMCEGEYTSIALDSSGHPHISYYDRTANDLGYAYFDGVSWHIEIVDAEAGCYSSLALDSSGNPHIVYDEFPKLYIRYAHFDGTSWHRETMVDWDGFVVGYDPSLALDSEGRAHISFYGETLDMRIALRYARQGPSATVPEPPTGLTATPGDAQVTLSWNAPSSDGGLLITNYEIYRGAFSGEESFYTEVGNVSSYIDTWAINGYTYYYQVSAKNFVGESQKSNEVSATPTAKSRIVGVNVGQWFKYADVTVSWESNDPNATFPPSSYEWLETLNETEWMLLLVEDVSGTKITFQIIEHYKNGAEETSGGYVDIDTGPSENLTMMSISANLDANDTLYTSGDCSTLRITETMVRTYPDGLRETNHLNMTYERSWTVNETEYYSRDSTNFYWDRSTGMLVEMSYEEINQAGELLTTWSFLMGITDSNKWVIPEFPAWSSVLILFVVLTAATIVYKRRLFKTPIH